MIARHKGNVTFYRHDAHFFLFQLFPISKLLILREKMLLQKTFDSIVPADIIEEGLLGENESQLNF